MSGQPEIMEEAKLYNFVGWSMMNSPYLDFEMLFKEINEPNLLSIMARGNEQSSDGEVIEVSQIVTLYNAIISALPLEK